MTNAFGDTDEDLKRKYKLNPEKETLTKAALSLVEHLFAPDQKGNSLVRHTDALDPLIPLLSTLPKSTLEAELTMEFLFSLLAGPIALAPLERRPKTKPHPRYAEMAGAVVVRIIPNFMSRR